MKLMKQIIATINKVETEKNPGPPTYVDPNKTIVASYSQGNELVLDRMQDKNVLQLVCVL